MGDDNGAAPDFQAALAEEFGFTPEPVETAPPAPSAAESEPAGGEAETTPPPAVAEEQVPPAGEAQPTEGEPANPQGGEPEPKTEDTPTSLTKDDIKAAISELNQESTSHVTQVHEASQEIINTLYPEGIDRNIYDSNGQVVKTAQDIVDRGLLKENGEPYTYEEAASFMLEANRKTAENVEELNKWAENVAEQNISLVEGNKRVMAQWGPTLQAMPELAAQLAEKYISTQLEFDKTNSYITKMATTPEDFYALVMPAYQQLAQSIVAKQQAEATAQVEAQTQAAQAEQAERSGLPPQRGMSQTKPNTGDPMLDALVEELAKE